MSSKIIRPNIAVLVDESGTPISQNQSSHIDYCNDNSLTMACLADYVKLGKNTSMEYDNILQDVRGLLRNHWIVTGDVIHYNKMMSKQAVIKHPPSQDYSITDDIVIPFFVKLSLDEVLRNRRGKDAEERSDCVLKLFGQMYTADTIEYAMSRISGRDAKDVFVRTGPIEMRKPSTSHAVFMGLYNNVFYITIASDFSHRYLACSASPSVYALEKLHAEYSHV